RRAVPGTGFSFAALLLCTSSAFTTYATSGLETMTAAALVCLALYLCAAQAPPWSIGLALTAAALTRPDQLLYGVAMGVALLRERRPRELASYAAPFAALFVPYWLWRWHAYGDFYPNTYYAKSAGQAYW